MTAQICFVACVLPEYHNATVFSFLERRALRTLCTSSTASSSVSGQGTERYLFLSRFFKVRKVMNLSERSIVSASAPGLRLSAQERQDFLNALLSQCDWVSVYFLWRPNLRDEADNHLLELAIAGGATHIITGNTKDFRGAALRFPQIKIVTPSQFLKPVRGS